MVLKCRQSWGNERNRAGRDRLKALFQMILQSESVYAINKINAPQMPMGIWRVCNGTHVDASDQRRLRRRHGEKTAHVCQQVSIARRSAQRICPQRIDCRFKGVMLGHGHGIIRPGCDHHSQRLASTGQSRQPVCDRAQRAVVVAGIEDIDRGRVDIGWHRVMPPCDTSCVRALWSTCHLTA